MHDELVECPICQQCKPRSCFPKRGSNRRYSFCKQCLSERYSKPRYAKKRAEILRYGRAYKAAMRDEIRARLLSYFKSHPCIDCGEPDPVVLEFDHVRGEKAFNISTAIRLGRNWDRVLPEIAKCDVRCANCHRRVTAARGNWYKQ